MKKRKPKIIKDKKERGEWAESVFISRASEDGLPASKPWGDTRSFDCVVGRPGKFVAVQVKCTIAKLESGEGYICSTCSSHKPYKKGSTSSAIWNGIISRRGSEREESSSGVFAAADVRIWQR